MHAKKDGIRFIKIQCETVETEPRMKWTLYMRNDLANDARRK